MTVASIYDLPKGRDVRPSVVLNQIGPGTLMGVGYQPATLVAGGDFVKFKVSRRFWLTIKLCADDTYAVEVGRMVKTVYVVVENETGVHVEQLATIVRELGDRE